MTNPESSGDSRIERLSAERVIHRWVTPLILTILFLVSVAVRWPFLNRPLGPHDEWLTSTVLRTMEIWQMEGAWRTYSFLPIMTYPGHVNYNIDNQAGVSDRLGRQYYLSYPPLAYI